MVYNKFLEGLNITYATNFVDDNDKRNKEWQEEREIYGFDNRETWCLDRTFAEWFYCHLKMYQLTEGKKPSDCLAYLGKVYVFEDFIDEIIKKAKFYLITESWSDEETDAIYAFKESLSMFVVILPILWIQKDTPDKAVLEKQRKEYTFDEREVYRLYDTFSKWLYPRIEMYDRVNLIDTAYHKFTINGKTMTQQECMDKIVSLCLLYEKDKNLMHLVEIINIWKEIFPAMWW